MWQNSNCIIVWAQQLWVCMFVRTLKHIIAMLFGAHLQLCWCVKCICILCHSLWNNTSVRQGWLICIFCSWEQATLLYTDSGANAFRVIEHHSVVTSSYSYHKKVNPIKQPNQHHLPLLCCLKHYHFTYLQQKQSLPACCQQHQQQQRIATGSMNKWVLKSKEIKTFFAA